MSIHDLISTGAIKIKWPTSIDGKKANDPILAESEICKKKCGSAPQCEKNGTAGEHTCTHGLSFINFTLNGACIKIYGVRGQQNKTKFNIYNSHGLKGRFVSSSDLTEWINTLRKLQEIIEHDFLSRQAEMLDPLHDPMRIAKQISTIANRLVMSEPSGRSFDDRLNNASVELKTLVKAADFLADSFDLLAIFFNPVAATFGGRSATNLHGLLMKLVSIFRIDDGGLTKSFTKIYLDGICHRNIFVYDSFKLIPFALISNAVKYSLEGGINVRIEERGATIEVSVESIGPLIEVNEYERIFERRGRGRWASEFTEGKGVGLYLSAVIAEAHGFKISVSSRRIQRSHGKIPLAHNRFYFEVPSTLQ